MFVQRQLARLVVGRDAGDAQRDHGWLLWVTHGEITREMRLAW